MPRSALLLVVLTAVVGLVLAGCSGDERPDAGEPNGATATAQTPVESPAAPSTTPASPAPTPTPEPSTSCPEAVPTGSSVQTLTIDGVERSYRLYVPASYDASAPVPLVLNFHGFGSTAVQQESYPGIIPIAEANGFVMVTPDGTNDPQRWHIYGRLEPGFVDDVTFAERMIDSVSATVCIDPARVFAMGISNGGGMSALFACRSHRIAAIATVAGAPFNASRCPDTGPLPVIAFHGTADTVVPFEGHPFNLPIKSVREDMHDWAVHNDCDLRMQSERIASDVVLERYTNCEDGADVLLYVIEGGGHTWPGSDFRLAGYLGVTTQSIEASELIWDFFQAHAGAD